MATPSRFRQLRGYAWHLSLVALLLLPVGVAPAAEKYKAGDAVEVMHLGDVTPGTVVGVDRRGFVTVEFPFAGTSLRRSFKPIDVRRALEPGTLSQERIWIDATGKFRIKAVLLSIEEKTVTLRKPDKAEVTLEIAKLSTADQKLIKELSAAAPRAPVAAADAGPGPRAPRVPQVPGIPDAPGIPGEPPSVGPGPAPMPVETFSTADIRYAGGENVTGPVALTPDPLPTYLTLQEGGAAAATGFFDKVTSVVPAGGKDGWLLATIGNDHEEGVATRLVWCTLARKKMEGQQLLPGGEVVLDYHAPSHRLLTYGEGKRTGAAGNAPTLSVWEVLPAAKEAKPILRWSIPQGEHEPPAFQTPWGRLVNGELALTRQGRNKLTLWDITNKSVRYQLAQEALHAQDPCLSGGRKYLVVPDYRNVRVYEAASGKLLSVLPAAKGAEAVGVSGDGRQLAVCESGQMAIWDLTAAAAMPRYFPIPDMRDGTVDFLNEERLMLSSMRGMILYSLKHKLPLWNYRISMADPRHKTSVVVAPYVVYATQLHGAGPNSVAIGAVKLPGPLVDQAATGANREELLLLKPGMSVRLHVACGEHDARVKAALEKKILANGWKLTPDATTVITAEIKQGPSESKTYVSETDKTPSTITVTPYISAVTIKVGEELAWQTGTNSRNAPWRVELKEGETLQGEIDKLQKPNPGFFDRLEMQAEILHPKKAQGFGTTEITSQGFEVLPTDGGPGP